MEDALTVEIKPTGYNKDPDDDKTVFINGECICRVTRIKGHPWRFFLRSAGSEDYCSADSLDEAVEQIVEVYRHRHEPKAEEKPDDLTQEDWVQCLRCGHLSSIRRHRNEIVWVTHHPYCETPVRCMRGFLIKAGYDPKIKPAAPFVPEA